MSTSTIGMALHGDNAGVAVCMPPHLRLRPAGSATVTHTGGGQACASARAAEPADGPGALLGVQPQTFKKPTNTPTYHAMITAAIESKAEKRAAVSDIFAWMTANHPHYSEGNADTAKWKASVRHALSMNKQRFVKVARVEAQDGEGKGGYWACVRAPSCTKKSEPVDVQPGRPSSHAHAEVFVSKLLAFAAEQSRPEPHAQTAGAGATDSAAAASRPIHTPRAAGTKRPRQELASGKAQTSSPSKKEMQTSPRQELASGKAQTSPQTQGMATAGAAGASAAHGGECASEGGSATRKRRKVDGAPGPRSAQARPASARSSTHTLAVTTYCRLLGVTKSQLSVLSAALPQADMFALASTKGEEERACKAARRLKALFRGQASTEWSHVAVNRWLDSVGLVNEGDLRVLKDRRIAGTMLADVDDEDLQEFGVTSRFERKRVLRALQELRRPA